MIEHLDIEEVLFLDIETVPGFAAWENAPESEQSLWTEKSRFIREKNNISLEESYHQAGIYAEFGKIICVSCGFFSQRKGDRAFRVTSFFGHDEAELLTAFADMLEKRFSSPFRILCAHNGKEFDFPYLCRRMLINGIALPEPLHIAGKKPWEVRHLYTMELWRFGDYKYYTRLELLAGVFGIPTSKESIDGSEVNATFYKEKDLEKIKKYCQRDVEVTARIYMAMHPQLDELEIEIVPAEDSKKDHKD